MALVLRREARCLRRPPRVALQSGGAAFSVTSIAAGGVRISVPLVLQRRASRDLVRSGVVFSSLGLPIRDERENRLVEAPHLQVFRGAGRVADLDGRTT
ncbi:hypothetical protein Sjap_008724 [Stephania japonica]|uniref:Uncharacterized protein n=1 Tax=Stephania japonica TaxID=461633 RepID=A0AAP0PEX0_9MAGN